MKERTLYQTNKSVLGLSMLMANGNGFSLCRIQ